ncbi:Mlo-related protein, partial [Sesbania bispinosa]
MPPTPHSMEMVDRLRAIAEKLSALQNQMENREELQNSDSSPYLATPQTDDFSVRPSAPLISNGSNNFYGSDPQEHFIPLPSEVTDCFSEENTTPKSLPHKNSQQIEKEIKETECISHSEKKPLANSPVLISPLIQIIKKSESPMSLNTPKKRPTNFAEQSSTTSGKLIREEPPGALDERDAASRPFNQRKRASSLGEVSTLSDGQGTRIDDPPQPLDQPTESDRSASQQSRDAWRSLVGPPEDAFERVLPLSASGTRVTPIEARSQQVLEPTAPHIHQHAFIKDRFSGFGKDSALLGWLKSFFKQFYGSVTKLDYTTLRLGFIRTHCRGNPKFNFHKYMIRALEDDFKRVVGISWYLWIFVIIFLLLNINGWHTYFWIAFIPVILLLAVGTKLEHVIIQLAHEVDEKHSAIEGELVVQPSDDHFWFHRPHIVLFLIHFILFQNSFEITFFFRIWVTNGFDSCIMGQVRYIVPWLIIG